LGSEPALCSCHAAQTHTGRASKQAGTPCDMREALARSRQQILVCNKRGLERAATLKKHMEKREKTTTKPNPVLLFHKRVRDHFSLITPLTQPGHHYIIDQKNCQSGEWGHHGPAQHRAEAGRGSVLAFVVRKAQMEHTTQSCVKRQH